MKNDIKWIIGAIGFVVVLILVFILYGKLTDDYNGKNEIAESTEAEETASDENEEKKKHAAPDFTVYDSDGNAVKLSDFKGKPVVLNFWASWCGPCKAEMPIFDAAAKEYSDVVFMMVNLTDGGRETLKSAKKFISESGYTFPVYYDTDRSGAYTYGTSSIPVTFFIDSEGYFAAAFTGSMPEHILMQGLALIRE